MQRSTVIPIVQALSAGAGLLWLMVIAAGLLAALPAPALLEPLRPGQGWLWTAAHSLLLFNMPMALAAGLFSVAAFRLIRGRRLSIAVALAIPWLAYCLAEAVSYYNQAQFPPTEKLALLLAWYTWFGRLSVPVGIWVAHRLTRPTASAA